MSTFTKLSVMSYICDKQKFSDKSRDSIASVQVAENRRSQDISSQLTDSYHIIYVNQLADFIKGVLKKGMLQVYSEFNGPTIIDKSNNNRFHFVVKNNVYHKKFTILKITHD